MGDSPPILSAYNVSELLLWETLHPYHVFKESELLSCETLYLEFWKSPVFDKCFQDLEKVWNFVKDSGITLTLKLV